MTTNAIVTSMSRLLCVLGVSWAAQAQVATFGPPAVPNMDDAVLTAGTSVVGNDGQNWAYVVWRSPGQKTLNGKAFAVYLQSVANGPFTRQAIVAPTAEPPALKLLLSRAVNLHADNSELDHDLKTLLRRKAWAGIRTPILNPPAGQIIQNDLQTSNFDSSPLIDKLSASMGRALQSEEAFASLNLIAPEHPALRMAIGRAWAGVLPPGNAPMIIELREWVNGTDGGVIGRVTITPGQAIALAAPGKVVQVPDLKPSGDLTIKIRWAVPDTLRRQQQHVLGFKAYRVLQADADGLTLSSTTQQITDWIAAHPLVIEEINEAPAPIGTLFDDFSVSNFSAFGGDRTTYCLADNANRGAPVNDGQPYGPRYAGFQEGQQCLYFVRAVDLLGRLGPPSPVGEGITARTVPPDVPRDLTVKDVPLADGTRQFELRWKANGTPLNVPGRTTQRYAIYRGDSPAFDGATTSLLPLEDPNQFRFQTPIAYVSQSQAQAGYLTFTDTTLTKNSSNTDRSIWYAVTALHDTALDWFASPPLLFAIDPHQLVQSAPSPPAFGVFRDRTGPSAPTGGIAVNGDKLVCLCTTPTEGVTEPRTPTSTDNENVHLRIVVRRPSPTMAAARVFISDIGAGPAPSGLVADSLVLLFPPDKNEIVYEVSLPQTWADRVFVTCLGSTRDGSSTNVGAFAYRDHQLQPDATVWNRLDFIVGSFALTDFASDSSAMVGIKDTATPVSLSNQTKIGPNVKQATAAGIPNGEFLIMQRRLSVFQPWVTVGTVQVQDGKVLFEDIDSNVLTGFYRAQRVTVGLNGKAVHDARPVDSPTIQPITVVMTIPETTKEWRVFRSVDEGPLAMVKSGIIDLTQGAADAIIATDKTMPPNGALMRYFGQCFDQNNNPSPLKFLGEVSLMPSPATPVLSAPETYTGDDVERVKLKWFCPTPGVKRFEIILHALTKSATKGKPVPVSSGVVLQPYGTIVEGGAPLINVPYKLAGDTSEKTGSIGLYYSFLTPVLASGDTNPLHEAEFTIQPDIPYVAFVQVVGTGDLTVNASKAYEFSWKLMPERQNNGPEPLVPWPARPLPPVVANPFPTPVMLSTTNFTGGNPITGFVPERSSVSNMAGANLYPVLVTVGILPKRAEVRGDYLTDASGQNPPINFDFVLSQSTDPLPPDKPTDPVNYTPGMTPCVLYRQTMLSPTKAGALVQVSPLRETIAWKREVAEYSAGGINYRQAASVLRDPFMKVMTYSFLGVDISYLTLADTHSVEEGATYRYYLATYETNGELKTVYDCGTITIPED